MGFNSGFKGLIHVHYTTLRALLTYHTHMCTSSACQGQITSYTY